MIFKFKEITNYGTRKSEAADILNKYPEKIPVIIEKVKGSRIDDLDKNKFLVPADISLAQLSWIIRKRVKLAPEKAMFLIINNNTFPTSSMSIGELYQEHRDEDGFLYVAYSGENIFGNELY